MNKRITFIDAARAVGIMLVVLGHVIGLGEMTFAWGFGLEAGLLLK